MANSTDLGTKFTCFKCECKFYDLGASEPICPRCGADQRENPLSDDSPPAPKSKRTKKATKSTKAKKTASAKPDLKTDDDEGSLLDELDDSSVEGSLADAVAERLPEKK